MKYLFLLFCFTGFISCELSPPPPECIAIAPFMELDYNSSDYQTAVVAKLEDEKPENYRYFFKTFFDEERKTFMILNFRNEKECFDVNVLVERWDKLGGMKKVNGKSYPKELVNLKWEIIEIEELKTVVYLDMDTIID